MLRYFIFKFLVNIKLKKEIDIKVAETATQNLFIGFTKAVSKSCFK